MMEISAELMPDRYKKRNLFVKRRFPKGCGRNAAPIERRITGNGSGGASSEEIPQRLISEVGRNLAGETLVQEIFETTRRPSSIHEQKESGSKSESEELPEYPTGKIHDIPMSEDRIKAVELPSNGDSNPFPMEDGIHMNENDIGIPDGNSNLSQWHARLKDVGIDDGVSKLYGPAKRRKISARRVFPSGCGRDASFGTRDEWLKKDAKDVEIKGSCLKSSLQGTIDGDTSAVLSCSQSAVEGLFSPHLEIQKDEQDLLKNEQNDVTSNNVFQGPISNSTLTEGCNDRGPDLCRSPQQEIVEENIGNIVCSPPIKTLAQVSQDEDGAQRALCVAEDVTFTKDRGFSCHDLELVKLADVDNGISGFQEDPLALGSAEGFKPMKPLMARPISHLEPRREGGMMSKNSQDSSSKLKKEIRIEKRKFLSGGSIFMRKKKAKKQPPMEDHCIELLPFGPSLSTLTRSDEDDLPERTKVRKALRLFQTICRKLLHSEESALKKHGQKLRIDIAAANILKAKNQLVNADGPMIGSVPGVEVGDQFHYRAELRVVGLHRSYQGGIDFARINKSLRALSVVASIGGGDDVDSGDFLIYSGSGGRPSEGDKPPEDQKLERGNLALKNCIEAKTPVRVIRRCKEISHSDSPDGRPKLLSTFTYDGLYLVEDYWVEKGPQGFSMYKFKLMRIPGQPETSITRVQTTNCATRGVCIEDISGGLERIPISVVNAIDDDVPAPFTYITKMIYPYWYVPKLLSGCSCTTRCSDAKSCSCAAKNGREIPFNFNGAIVEAKTLVYECGPSCKCPASCYNRVSQHGLKFPLEIFKTKSMGWGVRSLISIPSGSFICEYMGELIKDVEAEQRSNDEYLFDIGKDIVDGPPTPNPESMVVSPRKHQENGEFTIDAAGYGNVGRFINHSCSPNLYAQNVIYDHADKSMPHIMFFAAENIPPLRELTYHYNYTVGEILDADGNEKVKECCCGALECTGRLY
ncbi:histone-lysine N-methyltransferase, H3 lysine-9 specific SUVH6-like [Wolffia australiana]